MSSEQRTFPTKESYTTAILEELTQTELALLNFVIYYNPAHSQYYMMFQLGQYKQCWDYLMKHRDQLVLANVPEKWLSQAEYSIKSVKAMNLGKRDSNE